MISPTQLQLFNTYCDLQGIALGGNGTCDNGGGDDGAVGSAASSPISLSGGVGESHRLVPVLAAGVVSDKSPKFDPTTTGAVDTVANKIRLPYFLGATEGDGVVYSSRRRDADRRAGRRTRERPPRRRRRLLPAAREEGRPHQCGRPDLGADGRWPLAQHREERQRAVGRRRVLRSAQLQPAAEHIPRRRGHLLQQRRHRGLRHRPRVRLHRRRDHRRHRQRRHRPDHGPHRFLGAGQLRRHVRHERHRRQRGPGRPGRRSELPLPPRSRRERLGGGHGGASPSRSASGC